MKKRGLYLMRENYIGNIGDSRAYLLRGNEIIQISTDHVTKDKASSKRKAPLLQYLGMDPYQVRIRPTIERVSLRKGDAILLCTDGLTDMVPENIIAEIINSHATAEESVQILVEEALARGGRDNITVMVFYLMRSSI